MLITVSEGVHECGTSIDNRIIFKSFVKRAFLLGIQISECSKNSIFEMTGPRNLSQNRYFSYLEVLLIETELLRRLTAILIRILGLQQSQHTNSIILTVKRVCSPYISTFA
jgi:hypothetical protein